MSARGIASITAIAAVMLSGCTSDADTAGELQDIREVLEGSAEDEPSAEPEAAEQGDGAASAEAAPEADDAEPPPPDPEIDVTTVPDDITVEYVQAVVDELERILAEALVLMMEEGELTIEITDRVGEIFTLEQRDLRLNELTTASEEGFPGMWPSDEIAPRNREVLGVLDVSEGCIYIEALAFEEGLFPEVTEPAPSFAVLRFPDVERPVEINPTPWVYAALAVGAESELRKERPCQG